MKLVSTVAAAAVPAACLRVGPAIPQAAASHHVACFIQAIGPAKVGNAGSPISFGYTVHCTGTPDGRRIDYALKWKDATGEHTQAQGTTKDIAQDRTETFFSECTPNGRLREYFTQVWMLGGHGVDVDESGDSSDPSLLSC